MAIVRSAWAPLVSMCATAVAWLAVAACSGAETAGPSDIDDGGVREASAPREVPTEAGPADGAPADPRCVELESLLTAGVTKVRSKQKVEHVTVGVMTAECGKTVVFADAPSSASPAGPHDLWRLGSVTKTFVAAATINLARSGKLSLDDALAKWVPDFPNAENITLRQVLQHTSGIFNYTDSKAFLADLDAMPKRKFAPKELVAYAAAELPYFAPGKGWKYSNTDYVLAGIVLEKATGDSAVRVVRTQAFAKASLPRTFLDGDEPVGGALVHGFARGADVTMLLDPSVAWTAGAVVATPSDVLEWASSLYDSTKVLATDDLAAMEKGVAADGIRYGLGVEIIPAGVTDGNGVGYGHSGFIDGYRTSMAWFPAKHRGFVAIVADSAGDPNDLAVVALDGLATLR